MQFDKSPRTVNMTSEPRLSTTPSHRPGTRQPAMTISTPPQTTPAVSPPLHTHRRHRLIVRLALLVTALLILFVAAVAGAAWYFSSQLLNVRPDRPSYTLKVLALSGTTIKLPRTG